MTAAVVLKVMVGVVIVGLVPKTREPLPVSSLTRVARFALVGVVIKLAAGVPSGMNTWERHAGVPPGDQKRYVAPTGTKTGALAARASIVAPEFG